MRQLSFLALTAVLAVSACQSTAATPVPTLVIMTPRGDAGLSLNDMSLDLYLVSSNGGIGKVTSAEREPGRTTVHLYSLGGQTGSATNSFVFGEAPAGAAKVTVEPGNGQGQVHNGVYVVGLPGKDLLPDELLWRFLDGSGNVVEQGTGIR